MWLGEARRLGKDDATFVESSRLRIQPHKSALKRSLSVLLQWLGEVCWIPPQWKRRSLADNAGYAAE
jgi:hypothetical protein